jgi:hypothetical protein
VSDKHTDMRRVGPPGVNLWRCRRCRDTGIVRMSLGFDSYCDCAAGKEARDIGCLDSSDDGSGWEP